MDNDLTRTSFGVMVPKRHARRAVTRNLIKRIARDVIARYAPTLPPGLWLLRLRVGYALGEFVSARSAALAQAVRIELDALLQAVQSRSAASARTRAASGCAGAGA